MADLSTTYMGLSLKNPVVPSASPLSRDIGDIKWMEDAGAAAVVLYSLFEEQIGLEKDELEHVLSRGAQSLADASGYFPSQLEYTRSPDEYVEHVRKAKEAVDIPIIGSLNGASEGGWLRHAAVYALAAFSAFISMGQAFTVFGRRLDFDAGVPLIVYVPWQDESVQLTTGEAFGDEVEITPMLDSFGVYDKRDSVVEKYFPEYDGRGWEIAGFGWHQGWNDRINQAFNDEYETNLANLIRDVRKELGIDGLPFVIAETGMSGPDEKHPRALALMRAQAAVAEYPEFRGNVAFVRTRDFYRPPDVSPSKQGYHWNSNAETYFLIGDAMGRAMLHLAGARKR